MQVGKVRTMLYAIYRHEHGTDYLTLYASTYTLACDAIAELNRSLDAREIEDNVFYFADVASINAGV